MAASALRPGGEFPPDFTIILLLILCCSIGYMIGAGEVERAAMNLFAGMLGVIV
ncbi:hypothetical protein [Streptomyces malaysiensis]|uniref:hypothetical protein n=1 Tax=Streptomyces malaysiensis TaxID=92644 RepID=UPI002B2BC300|nr:hypothetical protein R8789_20520 [Streptomyces malaysiensis]